MRKTLHKAWLPMLLMILFIFMGSTIIANAATTAKITKQPVSVTVSNGTTAKIDLDAVGDGLTYTWYYKDKGSKTFSRTSTFKKDTYSVTMNSTRAGRQVYCIIKDKYGNKVKSKVATLNRGTTLKVTKQPKSVSVLSGSTAKVSFTAQGSGLTYKWYYKDKGASKFSLTKTFTGTSYSVKMNSTRNGRKLYCVITDKYGSKITTNTVTISQAVPAKITQQPKSVTAAFGKEAKVTLKASGNGLKYAWYYKDLGSSSFTKTTTFTGNTYTVTMNEKRFGRQIYCLVTDKYGNKAKSNVVTLKAPGAVPSDTPANKSCTACKNKTDGTSFTYDTVYTQSKKLSSIPLTFEAVLQIQKKDIDPTTFAQLDRTADYTETVIFSNDETYEAGSTYSITEAGHPKLAVRPSKWFRKAYNFVFDDVTVFSTKPVHLAITYDKTNNKVKCYVDGILKQTITKIPTAAKASFKPAFNYAVGGDLYSSNLNYFRGKLYRVSAYSDIRSATEIAKDFTSGETTSDSALVASYNFMGCDTHMLKDLSAKGNKLVHEKIWNSEEDLAPVGDFDYSFAVLGDTQEITEDYPEGLDKLYQWIVDNKSTHKIEYMLGLGDITQKSYGYEWKYVRNQIYRLNGSVPYLLSRGNHDWDTVQDGVVTEGFSTTFNDGVYNDQVTGVMTEGRMENAYRTINICGIDYLFLALDFGPNAEMLDWASSVVEAHPNHRVVIITHGYMYHDGTTMDSGDLYPASTHPIRCRKADQAEHPSLDGDDMWEQFVSKHENIQLVLSGHDPAGSIVYRQDQGEKGNTVTQMLIDPQHIDGFYGPTGMIAMFYFSDHGNTLTVRYYSVFKDTYGSESSQFTIDLSK